MSILISEKVPRDPTRSRAPHRRGFAARRATASIQRRPTGRTGRTERTEQAAPNASLDGGRYETNATNGQRAIIGEEQ
jgi:hypothetical protein